jgi:hypothetical protein
MRVRNKKKDKPFSEHKIEINKWKMFFSGNIASEGLVTEEQAGKIVNMMAMLTNTHLICKDCEHILHDAEFYSQVVQTTRRGKAHQCKECWKKSYRTK